MKSLKLQIVMGILMGQVSLITGCGQEFFVVDGVGSLEVKASSGSVNSDGAVEIPIDILLASLNADGTPRVALALTNGALSSADGKADAEGVLSVGLKPLCSAKVLRERAEADGAGEADSPADLDKPCWKGKSVVVAKWDALTSDEISGLPTLSYSLLGQFHEVSFESDIGRPAMCVNKSDKGNGEYQLVVSSENRDIQTSQTSLVVKVSGLPESAKLTVADGLLSDGETKARELTIPLLKDGNGNQVGNFQFDGPEDTPISVSAGGASCLADIEFSMVREFLANCGCPP